MTNINEKVLDILIKYSKAELTKEQITDKTNLLEDLKINSARLVDIIIDFEDEFNLEIDDTAADGVNTVGDAYSLITSMTSKTVDND